MTPTGTNQAEVFFTKLEELNITENEIGMGEYRNTRIRLSAPIKKQKGRWRIHVIAKDKYGTILDELTSNSFNVVSNQKLLQPSVKTQRKNLQNEATIKDYHLDRMNSISSAGFAISFLAPEQVCSGRLITGQFMRWPSIYFLDSDILTGRGTITLEFWLGEDLPYNPQFQIVSEQISFEPLQNMVPSFSSFETFFDTQTSKTSEESLPEFLVMDSPKFGHHERDEIMSDMRMIEEDSSDSDPELMPHFPDSQRALAEAFVQMDMDPASTAASLLNLSISSEAREWFGSKILSGVGNGDDSRCEIESCINS